MLVRYDQFIIQTCGSVQKRHKIHLKSSVTGSEFPRLAIIILRDYKGHIIDFVCHAVIEDHVFRSCFRISESIADIKPKCMSIYIAVPGTPVPSVIICPHTSSPVERSEMFFRVKFVPLSIIFCKTFRAHTIDFLVIIESSFFFPAIDFPTALLSDRFSGFFLIHILTANSSSPKQYRPLKNLSAFAIFPLEMHLRLSLRYCHLHLITAALLLLRDLFSVLRVLKTYRIIPCLCSHIAKYIFHYR